jgi:hypothetical protein
MIQHRQHARRLPIPAGISRAGHRIALHRQNDETQGPCASSPPLHAVLEDLSGLGLLVVDGYADLDPGGRPGLGAHAHAEFGIAVIGVAKSRYRAATHAVPVKRGSSAPRCSSRQPGCPPPTRPAWSGA